MGTNCGTRLWVVLPLFNDWQSAEKLIRDLEAALKGRFDLRICIVDDASTEKPPLEFIDEVESEVFLVRLGTNLGHQRAICTGLMLAAKDPAMTALVVMDSDGEDSAEAVEPLLEPVLSGRTSVAVAQRASRMEGRKFKALYRLYKFMFWMLAGERLDFGNFSALSRPAVLRILYAPETWNHYPGSLMRSRLPLLRIAVPRSQRYFGESKMNTSSLVTHGLAGLSVFVDRIFSRLLVVTAGAALVLVGVVLAGVTFRLFLQVPIPGWLALVTTAAFIGLIQIFSTLGVFAFMSLSMRSRFTPPPMEFASSFIVSVDEGEALSRDE